MDSITVVYKVWGWAQRGAVCWWDSHSLQWQIAQGRRTVFHRNKKGGI